MSIKALADEELIRTLQEVLDEVNKITQEAARRRINVKFEMIYVGNGYERNSEDWKQINLTSAMRTVDLLPKKSGKQKRKAGKKK